MGMFASYDQSVEFFKDNLGAGEGARILGASTVSGLFSAACSLPFDYVKTQIQKMQPDAEGKYPYTGSLDCALKTLKSGGPFKFYTGFPICGGEKSCCSNSHNESYIFSYPIFILKVTGKPDKA